MESLQRSIALGCEGAATVLAQIQVHFGKSPDAQHEALSLCRCAAVAGDVEAQLKLANALVGSDPDVTTQLDALEAEQWYLRICSAGYVEPRQKAQAQLQLAHLYMGQGKDAQAALYFCDASAMYSEAAKLKKECESRLTHMFTDK
ncbi:hypothetical protein D3C81_1484300 [compost metagenome]